MRLPLCVVLAAAPFLTPPVGNVSAQSRPAIQVTKLREGFYRLTSMVPYKANFLAYVSGDGILLVDAGQRQTGGELRSVLRDIAGPDVPIKILINTHAHIDHTGGNLALAGEPMIIGPEILRSTLRSYSYVLYEFPDSALPSITFSDSLTIHFGGETIRVIATPGSHDATDVIVHFTNAGIVCLGDIAYGMTFPSVDGYTGNLLKYPEVIDRILTLIPDDVTIVSGHGRETSVAELRQFRDMIVATTRRVHEEMAKGRDVATMQREDILKEWSSFDGGIGGNRVRWIAAVASAGPSRFRGSIAGELYKVLVRDDADAAIARYRELKKDHPTEYPFADNHLVRVGYWLLGKGRTADAIKLLQLYVSEFPDNANGYDSLGEAYMRAGDKDAAIRNYEKSLQLNPQNDNAKEMLNRLRADQR